MYYDPLLDVHQRISIRAAATTSYYVSPQRPDDGRRLFEAGMDAIVGDGPFDLPLPPARGFAASLVMAREWGMTDLEARLVDAIEASYEPTWDEETGEFTWGMGLDEPHPRGQFNAFLAAAEASGPGAWSRLSAEPLEPCPQVVDVDFPRLALNRAEWVKGALHLGLRPLKDEPNVRTTFRIVGAEPRLWELSGLDGGMMESTAGSLIVTVPLVTADIEFTPSSY